MNLEYTETLFFRKSGSTTIHITAMTVSNELGIIFAGLSNGCLIAWDLRYESNPIARVIVYNAHVSEITCLCWHPYFHLLISGGIDYQIKLWDPIFTDNLDVTGLDLSNSYIAKLFEDSRDNLVFQQYRGTVQPLILSDDMLSISNASVKLTKLVQTIVAHNRSIKEIRFVSNHIISIGLDGYINIYAVSKHSNLTTMRYPVFDVVGRIFLGYAPMDEVRSHYIQTLGNNTKASLYKESTLVRIPSVIGCSTIDLSEHHQCEKWARDGLSRDEHSNKDQNYSPPQSLTQSHSSTSALIQDHTVTASRLAMKSSSASEQTLFKDGITVTNPILTQPVVPTSISVSPDNSTFFVSDSEGCVHSISVWDGKVTYRYKIEDIHSYSIMGSAFISNESCIITIGSEGIIRGTVSETGRNFLTHINNRVKSYSCIAYLPFTQYGSDTLDPSTGKRQAADFGQNNEFHPSQSHLHNSRPGSASTNRLERVIHRPDMQAKSTLAQSLLRDMSSSEVPGNHDDSPLRTSQVSAQISDALVVVSMTDDHGRIVRSRPNSANTLRQDQAFIKTADCKTNNRATIENRMDVSQRHRVTPDVGGLRASDRDSSNQSDGRVPDILSSSFKEGHSTPAMPGSSSDAPRLDDTTTKPSDKGQRYANDSNFIVSDVAGHITVLSATEGSVLLDVDYREVVPPANILAQKAIDTGIFSTAPVLTVPQKSMNAEMYSVTKGQTTVADEYRILRDRFEQSMQKAEEFEVLATMLPQGRPSSQASTNIPAAQRGNQLSGMVTSDQNQQSTSAIVKDNIDNSLLSRATNRSESLMTASGDASLKPSRASRVTVSPQRRRSTPLGTLKQEQINTFDDFHIVDIQIFRLPIDLNPLGECMVVIVRPNCVDLLRADFFSLRHRANMGHTKPIIKIGVVRPMAGTLDGEKKVIGALAAPQPERPVSIYADNTPMTKAARMKLLGDSNVLSENAIWDYSRALNAAASDSLRPEDARQPVSEAAEDLPTLSKNLDAAERSSSPSTRLLSRQFSEINCVIRRNRADFFSAYSPAPAQASASASGRLSTSQFSTLGRSQSSFAEYTKEHRRKSAYAAKLSNPLNILKTIAPHLPADLDILGNVLSKDVATLQPVRDSGRPFEHSVKEALLGTVIPQFLLLTGGADNTILVWDNSVLSAPYHNYTVNRDTLRTAKILDLTGITGYTVNASALIFHDTKLSAQHTGRSQIHKVDHANIEAAASSGKRDSSPTRSPNSGLSLQRHVDGHSRDMFFNRLSHGFSSTGKKYSSSATQGTGALTRTSGYSFFHAQTNKAEDMGFLDTDAQYLLKTAVNDHSRVSESETLYKVIAKKNQTRPDLDVFYGFDESGPGQSNEPRDDEKVTEQDNQSATVASQRVDFEVRKASELPPCTLHLVVPERNFVISGHEDGSITALSLTKRTIMHVLGGHGEGICDMAYIATDLVCYVFSIAADCSILVLSVPPIGDFRLQYVAHAHFRPYSILSKDEHAPASSGMFSVGDDISQKLECPMKICGSKTFLVIGTDLGCVYVISLPLQKDPRPFKFFDAKEYLEIHKAELARTASSGMPVDDEDTLLQKERLEGRKDSKYTVDPSYYSKVSEDMYSIIHMEYAEDRLLVVVEDGYVFCFTDISKNVLAWQLCTLNAGYNYVTSPQPSPRRSYFADSHGGGLALDVSDASRGNCATLREHAGAQNHTEADNTVSGCLNSLGYKAYLNSIESYMHSKVYNNPVYAMFMETFPFKFLPSSVIFVYRYCSLQRITDDNVREVQRRMHTPEAKDNPITCVAVLRPYELTDTPRHTLPKSLPVLTSSLNQPQTDNKLSDTLTQSSILPAESQRNRTLQLKRMNKGGNALPLIGSSTASIKHDSSYTNTGPANWTLADIMHGSKHDSAMAERSTGYAVKNSSREHASVDKAIFIAVGYSNGLVRIFNRLGGRVFEKQFEKPVTSIAAIQREGILDSECKALSTQQRHELATSLWLGFDTGELIKESCEGLVHS